MITVNNDQVINDSTVLKNAINSVTSQTGITASGGGFGTDVSLNASKYGSAGVVTVNALAATNSADITLLNAAGTRKTVDAQNATGTISHGNGSGSFIADGERFTYNDASLSLEGTIDPSLTPSVRAARTIQRTTAGAGGLDSLTGAGTDTISFTLTGVVNGAQSLDLDQQRQRRRSQERQPLPGRPDQRHEHHLGRAGFDLGCDGRHRARIDDQRHLGPSCHHGDCRYAIG
ncbi:MAG: hypothetical protein QM775_06930 [Pirellulales bacterium]